MGFPRQEYWSGLPFPSPGDLQVATCWMTLNSRNVFSHGSGSYKSKIKVLPPKILGEDVTLPPLRFWHHQPDASLPSLPPSPHGLLLRLPLGLLSSPLRTPFTEFRTRCNPGCSHLINYLHLQRPFPNLRFQMHMNLERTLFNPVHNLKDREI